MKGKANGKLNGQPIGEGFTPIVDSIFKSEQYRRLPHFAERVLDLLIFHYREQNGTVSGKCVLLGCRAIATWYHVDHTTAWRALKCLQEAKFITEVHKGHIVPDPTRPNVSTTWRLNFPPFSKRESAAASPVTGLRGRHPVLP